MEYTTGQKSVNQVAHTVNLMYIDCFMLDFMTVPLICVTWDDFVLWQPQVAVKDLSSFLIYFLLFERLDCPEIL